MLIIREAQMKVFRDARRRTFENAAVARWTSLHPAAAGEAARDVVRRGIERALAQGLDKEDHILRFLGLMHCLGVDFDRGAQPWVAGILSDAELAPALRLRLLEERAQAMAPEVAAAS